jgi:hypothetical protein
MSDLKAFPGPIQNPARSNGAAPKTTNQPQIDAGYPGAPHESDASSLHNIPAKERYPGDGAPNQPVERSPVIEPRRERRDG